MSNSNLSPCHVSIGYSSVSGNLCPQDGVYKYANNNREFFCDRGSVFPQSSGIDVCVTLMSYVME